MEPSVREDCYSIAKQSPFAGMTFPLERSTTERSPTGALSVFTVHEKQSKASPVLFVTITSPSIESPAATASSASSIRAESGCDGCFAAGSLSLQPTATESAAMKQQTGAARIPQPCHVPADPTCRSNRPSWALVPRLERAVAESAERRDTRCVETGAASAGQYVDGRFLAIDEQGIGLRATWRPAHGLVNLSLWRRDECVETFHLTPQELSALVTFLVSRLATLAQQPGARGLALVEPVAKITPPKASATAIARRAETRLRASLAAALKKAATHIEP